MSTIVETKKKLSRDDVERELDERRVAIQRRLSALQGEISTAPSSALEAVTRHPLVGVGASLAAGLLVGLAFGGSKRGRKRSGGYTDDGRQIVVVSPDASTSNHGIVREMFDLVLRIGLGMAMQAGAERLVARYGHDGAGQALPEHPQHSPAAGANASVSDADLLG